MPYALARNMLDLGTNSRCVQSGENGVLVRSTPFDASVYLPAGHVRLFLHPLIVPVNRRDESLLSADEYLRAQRQVCSLRRQRFVSGRAYLRRVLSCYLHVAPHAIQLTYSANGKPSLNAAQNPQQLLFSVSHSKEYMVLALGRGVAAIGVDIEYCRTNLNVVNLTRRFFSQIEAQALAALPVSDRYQCFYEWWTQKEALLKMKGETLWDGGLAVAAPEHQSSWLTNWQNVIDLRSTQESVFLFKPRQHYQAALAVLRVSSTKEL